MHWYAIYCRPKAEKTVETGLIEAGIACFYPTYLKTTRWSDRKKTIEAPLFPGYLFARFPRHSAEEAAVLQIRGALGILGTSTGPVPIPDSEISAVMALIASGLPLESESYHVFNAGEKVEIKYGPFAGHTGVISRRKKGTRLIVAVAALQIATSVELDADCLRPLSPSKKAA